MDKLLLLGNKLTENIWWTIISLVLTLSVMMFYQSYIFGQTYDLKNIIMFVLAIPDFNFLWQWLIQALWLVTGIIFCVFLGRNFLP